MTEQKVRIIPKRREVDSARLGEALLGGWCLSQVQMLAIRGQIGQN